MKIWISLASWKHKNLDFFSLARGNSYNVHNILWKFASPWPLWKHQNSNFPRWCEATLTMYILWNFASPCFNPPTDGQPTIALECKGFSLSNVFYRVTCRSNFSYLLVSEKFLKSVKGQWKPSRIFRIHPETVKSFLR